MELDSKNERPINSGITRVCGVTGKTITKHIPGANNGVIEEWLKIPREDRPLLDSVTQPLRPEEKRFILSGIDY